VTVIVSSTFEVLSEKLPSDNEIEAEPPLTKTETPSIGAFVTLLIILPEITPWEKEENERKRKAVKTNIVFLMCINLTVKVAIHL